MAIDRPGVLQEGLHGTLLEVLAEGARPAVELLAGIPGVADVQVFGDRAHVRFLETDANSAAAAITTALARAGLKAVSVRPVPASLEDVFIDLITRTQH
jgi:hypothetical protein